MIPYNVPKMVKIREVKAGSLFSIPDDVTMGIGLRLKHGEIVEWVAIGHKVENAEGHPVYQYRQNPDTPVLDYGSDFVVWLSPAPGDIEPYPLGEGFPIIVVLGEQLLLQVNRPQLTIFRSAFVDLATGDWVDAPERAPCVCRWRIGIRQTLSEEGVEEAGVHWLHCQERAKCL